MRKTNLQEKAVKNRLKHDRKKEMSYVFSTNVIDFNLYLLFDNV